MLVGLLPGPGAQLLGLLLGEPKDLLDALPSPAKVGVSSRRALGVQLLDAPFQVGDPGPRGLQVTSEAHTVRSTCWGS